MAMNKEITKDSGLTVTYHRISKIEINYIAKYCNITIEEYVSEDFRNKAKQADELRKQLINLQYQISNTSDKSIIDALNSKYSMLLNNNKELLDSNFAAGENIITIDYIPEDTSYNGFYEILKQMEPYTNADLI